MIEKTVRFSTKRTVFSIGVGVHSRYVSHFKGLICAKVDLETQGHGITFTLCHALLKKGILHHKIAFFRFVFSTTVLQLIPLDLLDFEWN